MTQRIARCACGSLSATCEGEPLRRSICHCFACQQRSGSAFSWNAVWPDEQVRIAGESREFVRYGEEGHWGRHHFCPTCDNTVFWQIERRPGMTYVAVGCFSEPDFPEPEMAVYSEQAPPWLRFETKAPMLRE